jgi:hypothetical protein
MTTTDKFEQWAILEIMGHQRYAGLVSEQALGGASFVRIDVPAVDGLPPFSKLFGAGSIYCISPCSEEVALAMAKQFRKQPLQIYELPPDLQKRLSFAGRRDDTLDADDREYHGD